MKRLLTILSLAALLSLAFLVNAQPPYGYPGYMGSPSQTSGYRHFQRLRVEKSRSEAGYVVRIHTQNIDPQAVQVDVKGRFLMISNDTSQEAERSNDRGSYSYSRSSSSFSQRISIPRDADVEKMKRTESENLVTITLPVREGFRY
ncbi:MAG: Hsp20 family protein [gamma proteobacterium endosymbiont of Lamellibrachia anaximandri]|nr:Hsp20 family protein [gamma proteobacterium endosymbiont of Lamellibrachia anaximandri]MBL3618316.1 Hsp20 family protein [gamma proteobacterium endosymbiont of Lamellibrachia anaximandri]